MENTPEYKERVGACRDCGNSPVNHTALYCMSTVAIWHGLLGRYMSRFSVLARTESWLRTLLTRLDRFNYGFGLRIGLLRINHDVTKAASYRSQVVWEEAQRRCIDMEQLFLLTSRTEVYRAKIRGQWFYFESLPIPQELPQVGYAWLDDKVLLNKVLRDNGLPLGEVYSVSSEKEALRAFRACNGTAVTKPRAGSRGRHTTTHITNEEELRTGFKSAQKLCRYVYVGPHLSGSVCRGTVVNGKLAGFFQADPPRITGDGVSSITALIAKVNAEKPERVQDIVLTDEHHAYLTRLGYSEESVVQKGKRIDLTHRTGRLFGGATRELLPSVHPKLRAYLEHAAAILQVPIVGFDLIIEDPEKDPDLVQWGIIEANSLPFIDLHYLPLHGEPSNVAGNVWDLWGTQSGAQLTGSSVPAMVR